MIGSRSGWMFPPDSEVPPHLKQLQDFRNFLFLVFDEHGLGTPSSRQYEAAYFLQHGDGEGAGAGDFKLMLQGFRALGKSTITCCLDAWLLLWWPNAETIILSAAEDKAKVNCAFTRSLFDTVTVLRHLRPEPGQRDSAFGFDVHGKTPTLDPSVHAMGIMGQITGFHADALILDDVEVKNNSETPAARERLEGRTRELGGMSKPNTLRIWLGTPQTEDTIYLKMPDRGYTVRKFPSEYPDRARLVSYGGLLAPSIAREVEGDPSLAGTPTDPERAPEPVLDDRRLEFGAAGYAREMLLDTSLSDAERFPLRLSDLVVMDVSSDVAPETVVWASSKDLIRTDVPCLGRDGDRFHSPMRMVGEFLPYTGSVLAVDPSGRGRDEMAWFVVKILNGQLYVPDFGASLDGLDGVPEVAQKAAEHKVNAVVSEDYGGGSYAKLLGDALQAVGHPCALEVVTQRTRKEERILTTLEPVMARHRLSIDASALRRDTETARARGGESWIYYSLAFQMTRLANERDCLVHDDRVDALSIGVAYFGDRVELSTEGFVERREEEKRNRAMRERLARLQRLDPAHLEPNALTGSTSNRGLRFLRQGRRSRGRFDGL